MSLLGTIYTGKSGVSTMSQGISVSADNLANMETTGFKANRPLFTDLLLSATSEAPPSCQRGLGTDVETVEVLYQEGPLQYTNNPTDLAVAGEGFFTVTDGKNVFYTRDGNFLLQKDEDGQLCLVSASGYK